MIHVSPTVEAAKSAFHILCEQEDQLIDIRAYLTAIDAMAEQIDHKPLAGAIQVMVDHARRQIEEAEAHRGEASAALHPFAYPEEGARKNGG